MPKTPILADTLDRLSALNDQLCYLTFADQLTNAVVGPIAARDPAVFTTEAFPSNTQARRIHVRLGELDGFRHRSLATGFAAIVIASFEAVAGYMLEAQRLLETLGRLPTVAVELEALEDRLQAAVRAAGADPLGPEVMDTLAYLRLRRNQLSHPRETPANALATLIRQKGTHLDRFWGNNPAVFSFGAKPTTALSETEAIELVKLLRICTQVMDASVAAALDPAKVVRNIDEDLLAAQPHLKNAARYDDRIRKLDALAAMLYGLDVDARTIIEPT